MAVWRTRGLGKYRNPVSSAPVVHSGPQVPYVPLSTVLACVWLSQHGNRLTHLFIHPKSNLIVLFCCTLNGETRGCVNGACAFS